MQKLQESKQRVSSILGMILRFQGDAIRLKTETDAKNQSIMQTAKVRISRQFYLQYRLNLMQLLSELKQMLKLLN